ncbi:feruloyl esterase-like protein B precursor [Mollisia scopiformis]|uniref:Carboxylic ester hydrolase n=1 Tax=Mollisia scopiformis TaxID=149040 RepID=A0A194XB43_MOLSC|nr:feruloyl esterase-like protein B precursor [Mollisia scopiformis]KUJ17391.1 feruloyl esteras-like protein B precursor [Mollisia scopiformis]
MKPIPAPHLLLVSPSLCSANTFKTPTVHGAKFLSLEATLVSNYSAHIPLGYYMNNGAVNVTDVAFCNITVSYTHPGENDIVHVQIWMPSDHWNGRMQGIGGGGYSAGLFELSFVGMTAAVGEGYAAVSTDAGLSSRDPRTWALLSPGNVNLYLLQNLASVSLNDAALIGKAIIQEFYGQSPVYSYWHGCSQGGRQGLMLAQRYPDAYDGVAAAAPAINWSEFGISDYWPTFFMDQLGKYPFPCELDALTAAAVQECDGNDGVLDGVITDPSLCTFDPKTMIGKVIDCRDTGGPLKISSVATTVVEVSWNGPRSVDNSSLWYGMSQDAVLTGARGIAGTSCTNETCTRSPFILSEDWIKLFILKNSSADLSTMSHADVDHIFHASVQEYHSMIGTADPDIREFRDKGGKMITYHGLADEVIPPMGSKHYYDSVTSLDPSVHDYYRLFFAPGIAHCFGGSGAYPDTTFAALRQWVENGTAPDVLNATSISYTRSVTFSRPLCPYPQKQYYDGTGDVNSRESFYCK